MLTCPHCGRPVEVHLAAQPDFVQIPGGWRRADGQTLASTSRLSAAVRAGLEEEFNSGSREANYERITPVGRLEPRDVLTSLLDAGVTFGFFTLGVGGACWYFESPYIVVPAVASGFVAGCVRYYGGLALAKSLLQTIESVTRRDLNGDGHIGQPQQPAPPHTIRVEVKEGGRYQFATLGVEPEKLQALAVAVLRGDSFSERTATRYGLTQEEFRSLRDEFLDRGWASWNHPNRKQQGVSLTRGGLFILKEIKAAPLPSPTAQSSRAFGLHGSTQQHAARNSSRAGDFEFIEGVE